MKQAFDEYAESYDRDFSGSVIGLAQRQVVWRWLKKILSKNKKVLEINCGTGVDAFWIAPQVKVLDACDISEGMINVCSGKLEKEPLPNLHFFVKDINRISEIHNRKYDLIFSNFAGLNCLDKNELRSFAENADRLLEDKGRLALVFFGTQCAWEELYFALKRDPRKGRRQKGNGIPTIIHGHQFNTYYYSPQELKEIFTDYELTEIHPVGLFIPPGFMEKHFRKKGPVFRLLLLLEKLFGKTEWISNRADHFFISFQKRS